MRLSIPRSFAIMCVVAVCFSLFFGRGSSSFAIDDEEQSRDLPKGTMSQDQVDFYKSEPVEVKTRYEGEAMRIATTENLNFRVAKDRPIEKVAGVVVPVPIDAYIYQKFEELKGFTDIRFSRLEYRLNEMSKEIAELKTVVKTLESRKQAVQHRQLEQLVNMNTML